MKEFRGWVPRPGQSSNERVHGMHVEEACCGGKGIRTSVSKASSPKSVMWPWTNGVIFLAIVRRSFFLLTLAVLQGYNCERVHFARNDSQPLGEREQRGLELSPGGGGSDHLMGCLEPKPWTLIPIHSVL